MDWGKAKSIFIVAFLLLNISLGYQLYLKKIENIHNNHWSNNNIEEIMTILDQQDISLNIEIPNEIPEMHFVQVKIKKTTNYSESNRINNNINTNRVELEEFLNMKVYGFNEYIYDSNESNEKNYFLYHQTNDSYPFFGAKLEVFLREDGTISYIQNYYEIMNKGQNKEIISSYSALRTVLDQQRIPSGATITNITLGYHGQSKQSSIQLLNPVWQITYTLEEEKNKLYVNAMTGGILNLVTY